MKDLNMIVWLTQLGLSVAGPFVAFILVAVWLRQQFNLGAWVLIIAIVFGFVSAIDGFRVSIKAMEHMSKGKSSENDPPPVSFNDHI